MRYLEKLFITILSISIILVLTMFTKVLLYKTFNKKVTEPEYIFSQISYNNSAYTIPVFKNKKINNNITEFIIKNTCSNLEYEIFYFKESRLNLYLECNNNYQSYIFNLDNSHPLSIRHVVKNWRDFTNKVKELLNLKYPEFVTESISLEDGTYNIRKNEVLAKFNSNEFGEISVKLNNNEIKDYLDYDAYLDEAYENEVFKITPDKKLIAFTYDDGPSIYDKEIVEALKGAHATATFFEVGNRMNEYTDVIKYINENGMEIANHTFNHKILYELEPKEALDEIQSVNKTYKSITNKNIDLFRPSYGALNEEVVDKINMPIILWNVDTLDWKSRNEKNVYNKIIKNASDGDIILMHSLYDTTLLATKKSLKELYKKGFQVVSVSELAKLKNINLEKGKIYRCLGCLDPDE